MNASGSEDWRYRSDQERIYGLAYLRWLGQGGRRRGAAPDPRTYTVAAERARLIREDIEQLVRGAASVLRSPRI